MSDNEKLDNIKDKKPQKRSRRKSRDYPAVPLQTALEVCEAIRKSGGMAENYGLIGKILNVRGGALNNRITAARRYGLVEKDKLINTELANKILKPIEHDEDKNAQRRKR